MSTKSKRQSSQGTGKQASLVSMWSGGQAGGGSGRAQVARESGGDGGQMHGNLLQDLLNVYGHYEDNIENLERASRLNAANSTPSGSAKKRKRRESDEFLSTPPPVPLHCDATADEYGHKYVDLFCSYMDRGFGRPSDECKYLLMTIIGNHKFHESPLLSTKAARALGQMNVLYPAATVGEDSDGLHVEENSSAWKLKDMTRVESFKTPSSKADSHYSAINVDEWAIVLGFVRDAVEAVLKPETSNSHFGSLLMLEQVVAAMHHDFASRLEVLESRSRAASKKEWRVELLQNSYLGRLLQLGEEALHRHELDELLQGLVTLIGQQGGCGDDELDLISDEDEPNQSETAAADLELVSPIELAAIASDFLHIILEYLGALESSGKFLNARSGALFRSNLRVEADIKMFDAYRDLNVPQKAAFLSSLPARDKTRFIGSVIARFRAKRESDSNKFPELVRVCAIYDTESSKVSDFVDVDFIPVLEYVASDCKNAADIKGVGGRDGLLCMLCEGACAAAEMMLHTVDGKQMLAQLQKGCEKVFSAFQKGSEEKPLLECSIERMYVTHAVIQHAADSLTP